MSRERSETRERDGRAASKPCHMRIQYHLSLEIKIENHLLIAFKDVELDFDIEFYKNVIIIELFMY